MPCFADKAHMTLCPTSFRLQRRLKNLWMRKPTGIVSTKLFLGGVLEGPDTGFCILWAWLASTDGGPEPSLYHLIDAVELF